MRGQKLIDRDSDTRLGPGRIAAHRRRLVVIAFRPLRTAAIHHADHRCQARSVRLVCAANRIQRVCKLQGTSFEFQNPMHLQPQLVRRQPFSAPVRGQAGAGRYAVSY